MLAVCAGSICLILVFGLSSNVTVWAQVQDALKSIHTASYSVANMIDDRPALTWKVTIMGEQLCRVEQPNGVYLIFDVQGKKVMEVNPSESKVRITENLPIAEDHNLLAKLANLGAAAAQGRPRVPHREIGGVKAAGFVLQENGVQYHVWVDPSRHLPVEVERVVTESDNPAPPPWWNGGPTSDSMKPWTRASSSSSHRRGLRSKHGERPEILTGHSKARDNLGHVSNALANRKPAATGSGWTRSRKPPIGDHVSVRPNTASTEMSAPLASRHSEADFGGNGRKSARLWPSGTQEGPAHRRLFVSQVRAGPRVPQMLTGPSAHRSHPPMHVVWKPSAIRMTHRSVSLALTSKSD